MGRELRSSSVSMSRVALTDPDRSIDRSRRTDRRMHGQIDRLTRSLARPPASNREKDRCHALPLRRSSARRPDKFESVRVERMQLVFSCSAPIAKLRTGLSQGFKKSLPVTFPVRGSEGFSVHSRVLRPLPPRQSSVVAVRCFPT